MMNKGKRIMAIAMTGAMLTGMIVLPVRAAILASEEPVEGVNVVLEEYCDEVVESPAATDQAVQASPVPTPVLQDSTGLDEEEDEVEGHVELNLNYSRLGIASNVDTYLNVRKKPSTSSKIVGKMTKNSGCHIYSIKKGWAKIVSGQVKGYVKASYLSTDQKAEDLVSSVGRNVVEIQTDSLRVRALPTTDAPIYSIVSEGEEFTIKKDNLTLDFVQKIIEKEKISKDFIERAGGLEAVANSMADFMRSFPKIM